MRSVVTSTFGQKIYDLPDDTDVFQWLDDVCSDFPNDVPAAVMTTNVRLYIREGTEDCECIASVQYLCIRDYKVWLAVNRQSRRADGAIIVTQETRLVDFNDLANVHVSIVNRAEFQI